MGSTITDHEATNGVHRVKDSLTQSRDDLYSRPLEPKIFISSEMRSKTLSEERVSAATAVESTGRARAWYWERDSLAGPYSSESVCLGQAKTSDGLILLVTDSITQIVRDEYLAAHNAGAPCFVFLKAIADRDAETVSFVTDVRNQGHVTVSFDNTEDLFKKIVNAINHHFTWTWREGLLSARLHRVSASAGQDAFTNFGSAISTPSRPYELVPISIDYEVAPAIPLSKVVDRAHKALETGNYRGAINLVLDAAGQAGAYGFSDTVAELVHLVLKSVPANALERSDQAWILNLEGLALSHQGSRPEALTKFLHMKRLGEDLGDHGITSTAMQNLAIQAQIHGDFEKAEELNRSASQQMLGIHDFRGALQVAIFL